MHPRLNAHARGTGRRKSPAPYSPNPEPYSPNQQNISPSQYNKQGAGGVGGRDALGLELASCPRDAKEALERERALVADHRLDVRRVIPLPTPAISGDRVRKGASAGDAAL